MNSYDNKRRIGQNIKDIREFRGLSQEKLEELSGVERSYISNIETAYHKKNPTIIHFLMLAEALGATITVTMDKEKKDGE